MHLFRSVVFSSVLLANSSQSLAESRVKSLDELQNDSVVTPDLLRVGTGETLSINCIRPHDSQREVLSVRQSTTPSTGLTTRFEVLNTYSSVEYCRPNTPFIFLPKDKLSTRLDRTCYIDAMEPSLRSYLVYEIRSESSGLVTDIVPLAEFSSIEYCQSNLYRSRLNLRTTTLIP